METTEARPSSHRRLESLDVFRGLTVFLMLLVNNVALDVATPAHLKHAEWNQGITLADLVFPWFLFCVGVSIPFSARSFLKSGLPRWRLDLRILTRCMALFGLGLLVNSAINHAWGFSLGVLQLIALAYFLGAFLYELSLTRRVFLAAVLLLSYGFALMFLPIPGSGAGAFAADDNLIQHINSTFLAPHHLNGLFSVVPTGALVLLGTALGDLFLANMADGRRLGWLGGSGVLMVLLGILWNQWLPFNKPVWTPPYILLAGGLGTLVLAALYWVVDSRRWNAFGGPFVVFGSNPMLAYIAPILVKVLILQTVTFGKLNLQDTMLGGLKTSVGPVAGGWLYTSLYIVFWWLILWGLHRKKLYFRV